MKVRFVGLMALCCALVLVVSFPGSHRSQSQSNKVPLGIDLSQAARELLNEINQARAHPQMYASYLEGLKPFFNGKEYKPTGYPQALITQEGWSAVEEAIKFLRSAQPHGPLHPSIGLSLAALALCKDQGGTGGTGHKGGDSTFIERRVKPFGTWEGGIGENLTYGNESARERFLTWLIDDGFASRGHRNRLMSENYRVAGVSCGPHPEFGTMCVLELAGGFIDSAAAKSPTSNQTKSSGGTKDRPPSATLSVTPQSQSSGAANKNPQPSTSSGGANTKSKTTNGKPR